MNPAHPLLQAVGVPWNVVVKHDVADLQVDSFASSLRGDEHLNDALPELLFRVKTRSWFVSRAGSHTAMDESNFEPPIAQALDQVV